MWFSISFIMAWLHIRAIIREKNIDKNDGIEDSTSQQKCFYLVFSALAGARIFMTIFVPF